MKNCFLTAALLLAGALGSADALAAFPEGYYDSLNGKSGAALKNAVKAIGKQGFKAISYGDNTWAAFRSTDVRIVNGRECWWDMYSNDNVAVSSGHPGMNIEHSVANSWWGGSKNNAYKDIVHLNPSNSTANSKKSNYPLGELSSVSWTNGVTSIGKPKSGMEGGQGGWSYEPADMYKGDFARVFMYMFTIYDNISWETANGKGAMFSLQNGSAAFKSWAYNMLLKWSLNDPVSEKEIARNDGIYKEQGNRNPFIDLPDLADYIWGAKQGQAYSVTGAPVDPNPGGEDPVDPENPGEDINHLWLAETSSSMDADWTIENVKLPSGSNYVWSWKSYDKKYYLNGSAYINGKAVEAEAYIYSPVVDLNGYDNVKMSFDHAAKFQTTFKDLCGVVVRIVDGTRANGVENVTISKWPSAGSWTFTNSGDIDLSRYAGHKVQVGFKYASNTKGADTWEIRNVKLTAKATPTAVEEITDTDDSCFVEVWGNNIIAPEGARIFDLNGREVRGENLAKGIYIVTKPTFRKSIKVMIK